TGRSFGEALDTRRHTEYIRDAPMVARSFGGSKMAWSWSHTAEAYSNARENLENQDREFLDVCLAEWQGSRDVGYYRRELSPRYEKSLQWARRQDAWLLVDIIWEQMEQQATCDNGGWNAWCCPFGCHTVSFSCEGEEL